MKRSQLEHLIRASADIADVDEIVIIGSQAILGQFPDAPAELLVSVEAAVFPLGHPERSDLIDGSIGEGSPFHATFGYYARGVDESTAVLPRGWKQWLVPIRNENKRGVTGLCLELHDLQIAQYVAGRDKDRRFTAVATLAGLAQHETLLRRLEETELDGSTRSRVQAVIERDSDGQPS